MAENVAYIKCLKTSEGGSGGGSAFFIKAAEKVLPKVISKSINGSGKETVETYEFENGIIPDNYIIFCDVTDYEGGVELTDGMTSIGKNVFWLDCYLGDLIISGNTVERLEGEKSIFMAAEEGDLIINFPNLKYIGHKAIQFMLTYDETVRGSISINGHKVSINSEHPSITRDDLDNLISALRADGITVEDDAF